MTDSEESRFSEIDEIFDKASTGFLVVEPDSHRIEYINDHLLQCFDYRSGELLDRRFEHFIESPSGTQNPPSPHELKNRTPDIIECRFLDAEGRARPVRLVVTADELENDECLMILVRPESRANGSSGSEFSKRPSGKSESTDVFDLDDSNLGTIMDEVYVFEPDTGQILECNETASTRTGYPEDELLEMTVFDLVEEYDSLERWLEKIESYRRGSPDPAHGHHVRKNGSTYPVEANSTLIQRNNQEYLISVARDISQRRAREEETEQLFNSVNDAITVHDPETNELIDVNQTLVDILGFTREEILEKGIAGISARDEGFTQERVDQYMDWIDENEGPYEPFEWAMRDANGNKVWFEVGPNRLRWRGQDRVLTISREITERKENAEKLKYRQSLLKAQQEAADEGILVVSENREILSYNDQFQELWGVPDEVLDRGEDEVALEYAIDQVENAEDFIETVEALYDQPDVTHRDELRLKDGRILERYTSPVQLDDRYFGRVWFFRDVTENRRVKEKLETSLKEKETLLEEVHHRVKNNIQVIISLLKMQMRFNDSEELRESYRDSIHRLETMALIHEKLYQSEHLAEVNFPKYVDELCDRLIRSYERGEDTELEVDVDELELDIDDSITCGLIINELVSNALEHGVSGREGGFIDVECSVRGDEVKIRVADNGQGVSADYELTDANSTGMNIVRSLVDYDLEGSIEWYNENGFVVEVSIPRENLIEE